jgi:hypothetical protein
MGANLKLRAKRNAQTSDLVRLDNASSSTSSINIRQYSTKPYGGTCGLDTVDSRAGNTSVFVALLYARAN